MTERGHKPYGAINQERLKSLESRLDAQLPADYRKVLEDVNGGRFENTFFHISDLEGESRLHHVYGLHEGPEYLQLDQVYEIFRDRIPSQMLAVAEDGFGNQICLSVRGNHRGEVYFWNHDSGDLIRMTRNWTEFMEGLAAPPPPTEPIEKVLDSDDVNELDRMVKEGFDPESKLDGDVTLIEQAAIKAKPNIIKYLAAHQVDFGRSLEYASKNALFFSKHRHIVELLLSLKRNQ